MTESASVIPYPTALTPLIASTGGVGVLALGVVIAFVVALDSAGGGAVGALLSSGGDERSS